jgi:general secretion pathway protein K
MKLEMKVALRSILRPEPRPQSGALAQDSAPRACPCGSTGISNQRGVALLVVLWIFIFLFVVAFDFSAAVRDEASAAHRYGDETQGYYLALAGFERALFDFLQQAPSGRGQQSQAPADLFAGTWTEGPQGSGYRFRLIDEGGKININRIDENKLRSIFTNMGIEEPRRSILVDSIMDWRDPDDLHRINGAESDYYQSLPVSYSAKNGPFDTVEDLLWVRGVTTALFYGVSEDATAPEGGAIVGLKQLFTVDSPNDRVNLRTASAEVIHALTGIDMKKCQQFVEERKKLSDKSLPDLLALLGGGTGDPRLQNFVFTNPSVISVEAEGQPAESQVRRRVRGVVRAAGGQARFEIVRWIDRDNQASGANSGENK